MRIVTSLLLALVAALVWLSFVGMASPALPQGPLPIPSGPPPILPPPGPLKIRQVQGSVLFALGRVFSPPYVVDSLAFDHPEIAVPTDAVLAGR
jgi:hypothetical protein